MREEFEKWWEAHGTQSTVHKEDFWDAWCAGATYARIQVIGE